MSEWIRDQQAAKQRLADYRAGKRRARQERKDRARGFAGATITTGAYNTALGYNVKDLGPYDARARMILGGGPYSPERLQDVEEGLILDDIDLVLGEASATGESD